MGTSATIGQGGLQRGFREIQTVPGRIWPSQDPEEVWSKTRTAPGGQTRRSALPALRVKPAQTQAQFMNHRGGIQAQSPRPWTCVPMISVPAVTMSAAVRMVAFSRLRFWAMPGMFFWPSARVGMPG